MGSPSKIIERRRSIMGKLVEGIRKYAMTIVLVLVVIFFTIMSGGKILQASNINNLIAQNA